VILITWLVATWSLVASILALNSAIFANTKNRCYSSW